MRTTWPLGLILIAILAGVVRGDDYVLVRSIPFPQPSNGAGTGITYLQGKIAFVTQKPGTEDIYLIDSRSGAVATQWPAPAGVVSGLADDGTLLYAVDGSGIFGMDLLGRVTTELEMISEQFTSKQPR